MNNGSLYQPNNWMRYHPVRSSPTPYEILVRQSRRLGRTAGRALEIAQQAIPHMTASLSSINPMNERQFFERHPDRIHTLAAQSREVLAQARTVPFLPLNVFPDTITVDRVKVKIDVWRTFLFHEEVTLLYGDIKHVSTTTGVLFSSLIIAHQDGETVIEGLLNRDAERLCCTIRGYRIALREGVQVEELSLDRLRRKVVELGGALS